MWLNNNPSAAFIHPTFAAVEYSFFSPPRLCGSKPDHAVATVSSRSYVLVSPANQNAFHHFYGRGRDSSGRVVRVE
jgi:hypothetical protein